MKRNPGGVVEEKSYWLKRNSALGQMFRLHKKSNQASKPQQDKQRNQRKSQHVLDDDEKMVRNGDRPFTKAKRSNCDMLDRNELQTYASLEKMLHKAIFAMLFRNSKRRETPTLLLHQNSNQNSFYQVLQMS
ncbi:hypothetical protein YC2023_011777 [Brassica napus]